MSDHYLHGVNITELDNGARPIRTVKSAVIGLIGTAPDADATAFPFNTPVLIAGNRSETGKLGTNGSLLAAIDGIFDQAGTLVVVIRVETDPEPDKQLAQIIGPIDQSGKRLGIHAFLDAEAVLGVVPKILIAPEFSQHKAFVSECVPIAERLRAIIIADGPSTNDQSAIEYSKNSGSSRVYLVDPAVRVFNPHTATESLQPASPRVAGLIARVDHERGFWWSPSNQEMYGIVGTQRPIDFTLGDPNARANLLNEKNIATIIRKNGYRLWGNRTCSFDPRWAFLSVRRTADMINESLLRAHLWAVDRNITKTYIEDVCESVNAYLRSLQAQGAILGGTCWANPELNTPANIAQGKVYFDFDFTPPAPAEHITFRSSLVNDYIEELL